MKSVTIRQSLQHVANYPHAVTDEVLQIPAHELISRTLFEIANKPDPKSKGSLKRSNAARKMILDRLGGRRRSGTRPVTTTEVELDFIDLTEVGGELPRGEATEDTS